MTIKIPDSQSSKFTQPANFNKIQLLSMEFDCPIQEESTSNLLKADVVIKFVKYDVDENGIRRYDRNSVKTLTIPNFVQRAAADAGTGNFTNLQTIGALEASAALEIARNFPQLNGAFVE